jgi:hypothetical protein
MFGCSRGNGRMALSGTISLDGKPLEAGAISFRPAPDNDGNSSGGQIESGEFRLSADRGLKPGKYLVTVQAFNLTGRTVMDPQMGKVPERVLVQYNEAGKLEATVAPGEPNRFEFQLTSRKWAADERPP